MTSFSKTFAHLFVLMAALCLPLVSPAQHDHVEHADHSHDTLTETPSEHAVADEKFNPTEVIMHHIADAHDWHLFDWKGNAVSIPLPVILYTDNGLKVFMSSAFHHDDLGMHQHDGLVKYHGKLYYANAEADAHGSYISFDEQHHPANAMPLDFSITKNVASMFVSVFIILMIFIATAKNYTRNSGAPKGIAAWMEPLIIFVRDDIARPNIGHKYEKFMPYLLTAFFFIWFNNLLGLIPIIPGGANLTGNIAVTLTLAFFTLVLTNINGNKGYWKHIFATPGVPVWLYPIMIPVELIGIVTKPFALMIRLFANITAGHIVILSLISLIFIFKSVAMAAVSVPFALFISVLELLVAALQAYIFTMLSALFIGSAVAEHEHH
jgi:F-type H+-transporting ATPase subunit a